MALPPQYEAALSAEWRLSYLNHVYGQHRKDIFLLKLKSKKNFYGVSTNAIEEEELPQRVVGFSFHIELNIP